MQQGQFTIALEDFIKGKIKLAQLNHFVEERLFELRQIPEMTEEKRVLSTIELYLHEISEGQRSEHELHTYVQSILGATIPVKIIPQAAEGFLDEFEMPSTSTTSTEIIQSVISSGEMTTIRIAVSSGIPAEVSVQ